jgi:monomeric sarcosine oxidase
MGKEYAIIIVGAGSFGMSAGYYIAKTGVRVLLIDAYNPPHENGSHHGQTRIFRTAYTMGSSYVALALRARELWLQLAEEAQALQDTLRNANNGFVPSEIFRQTGVVSIGDARSRFLQSKQESCEKCNIPHQRLKPSELMSLWPGLSVPEHAEGLYEPEAGVLFSENIIRTYRALALHYGAEFLPGTKVLYIESGRDGHAVRTTNGIYYADRVLVCGGAWSAEVLPELKERVRPTRKAIGWFEAPRSLYGDESFPAFIVNKGGDEEYYGIPDIDGTGLKVGRHDGGEVLGPGQSLSPFGTFREDEEDLKLFLNRYLPGVKSLKRGSVCLYENAPGEHFLIGQVPGRSGVWFAGGGSGHGFKFGSSIGEALSELLTTGQSRLDLSAFQFHT